MSVTRRANEGDPCCRTCCHYSTFPGGIYSGHCSRWRYPNGAPLPVDPSETCTGHYPSCGERAEDVRDSWYPVPRTVGSGRPLRIEEPTHSPFDGACLQSNG
jgi:hypothetical protein